MCVAHMACVYSPYRGPCTVSHIPTLHTQELHSLTWYQQFRVSFLLSLPCAAAAAPHGWPPAGAPSSPLLLPRQRSHGHPPGCLWARRRPGSPDCAGGSPPPPAPPPGGGGGGGGGYVCVAHMACVYSPNRGLIYSYLYTHPSRVGGIHRNCIP
jgi:hypothetical protein